MSLPGPEYEGPAMTAGEQTATKGERKAMKQSIGRTIAATLMIFGLCLALTQPLAAAGPDAPARSTSTLGFDSWVPQWLQGTLDLFTNLLPDEGAGDDLQPERTWERARHILDPNGGAEASTETTRTDPTSTDTSGS